MYTLAVLVNGAFEIYSYILIARILLTWVNHDPYHPIIKFIYQVTDPILEPVSRVIPPIGMIDISPIIVFFLLNWLKKIIVGLLLGTGFFGGIGF